MKLRNLAGVLLVAAAPTNTEAAPVYRDIPLDLDDCAGMIVEKNAPPYSTLSSFEKEDRDTITHEFSAVRKQDGLEYSLSIVTYPKETGQGSIVITARQRNEVYNYLAVGVMDRADLQANATVSIQSLGQDIPLFEETTLRLVTNTISDISGCVKKFDQADGSTFVDYGL